MSVYVHCSDCCHWTPDAEQSESPCQCHDWRRGWCRLNGVEFRRCAWDSCVAGRRDDAVVSERELSEFVGTGKPIGEVVAWLETMRGQS